MMIMNMYYVIYFNLSTYILQVLFKSEDNHYGSGTTRDEGQLSRRSTMHMASGIKYPK